MELVIYHRTVLGNPTDYVSPQAFSCLSAARHGHDFADVEGVTPRVIRSNLAPSCLIILYISLCELTTILQLYV